MRPLVLIESPYRGRTMWDRVRNTTYARRALLDSIARGEAPMASHLLYPQVLDEDDPAGRALGIELGLAWRVRATRGVFYVDLGWSPGMHAALEVYRFERIETEERRIHP